VIVVDLGCQDYGYQNSLGSLADTYKPEFIYGFDPSPKLEEGKTTVNGVPAILKRKAAWTHYGDVPFHDQITSSRIMEGADGRVRCFDFSSWIGRCSDFWDGEPFVVKMDIEGAEYPVLDKMIADGTDRLVSELVMEWHGPEDRTGDLLNRLACPVKDWWM